MDNNAIVKRIAAVSPSAAPQPVEPPRAKTGPAADVEGAARYRLIIEEGPSKGSFVYKTMDSITGEIVRQYPREQILRLAEAAHYDKGAVINTSA